MFTGLIQSRGTVLNAAPRGRELRLRIQPLRSFSELRAGESIAVNGVCLTVEEFSGSRFSAYASAETLQTSGLGRLKPGDWVNLERAMTLSDRLGGHLVSGHVDCQAEVSSAVSEGSSTRYVLTFAKEWSELIVAKGSVALDGISLTVNRCGNGFLEVNIIPATAMETTVATWTPGARVNMETDLIGKYVQHMLKAWTGSAGKTQTGTSGLSLEFLQKHGFGS